MLIIGQSERVSVWETERWGKERREESADSLIDDPDISAYNLPN